MVTNGGSITFTGLSSGIDTGSIVTQLIAVESAPKTLLINQQNIVNLQQQDYSDISAKLLTLKTASDALRDFSLYAGSPTATSADTTKLTATATGAAAASSYNVVVSNIARAAVMQQTATSDVSAVRHAVPGERRLRVDRDEAHRPHDLDGRCRRLRGRRHHHAERDPGRTADDGLLPGDRLEHGRRPRELAPGPAEGLERVAPARRRPDRDERSRASIRRTSASR